MSTWIQDATQRAIAGVRRISTEVDDFPHITEDGVWQCTRDGVWTGGFWAGSLWLSAAHSREGGSELSERAVHFTDRLLARQDDHCNHDLGFMFYPSAIRAWQATGDERYRLAAVRAAESLAGQFNADAGFIPGWGFFGGSDWSGSVLVDTLMNLPLLVWASERSGNTGLLEVVTRHAATTMRHHLRPDGSVFHVYRFDERTGHPLGGDTYQGMSAQSAWSRGQSWALTGLAILSGMLGDASYRKASERIAAYFTSRLPLDVVPPWDFDATGPGEPRDASAGAIASYGLLRLHRVTGERRYLDAATRLLQALASSCGNDTGRGGLLLHATADRPHGLGVDESTAYGDYYYLKSLVSLQAVVDGR